MKNGFLKQVSMVILAGAVSLGSVAFAETDFNKNFKETDRALDRQRPLGEGTGITSTDYANIMIGVVNVTPIFGTFHENEVTRDLETRICAEMGVSELSSGGGSTGEHCCKVLWEMEGKTLHKHAGVNRKMGGFFGGRNKDKQSILMTKEQFEDYCCRMSDDKTKGEEKVFCKTVAQEKAGCVNGELKKNGQNMEAALSACELECDIKQYGTLKHNENGEYDKEEVDGMVKTCTMDNVDWAPSTTVPGAEAFIPAVPTNAGDILKGGEDE